jgi:ribose transport system substrate-binding protein
MTKRRLAAIALVTAAAVATVAAATSSGAGQKKFKVAYIPPVIANPTTKAAADGMALEAKKLGMDYSTVGGEYDPAAQIVAVNAVLQRKFDALAIWPLDDRGIRPSLDKVAKAGIPILVQDSPKAHPYSVNFQYNDYESEYKIAQFAAKDLKAKGKPCAVGIIQGIPVVEILNNRNKGLEDGAKASGCTILAKTINTKDNADGARPIADAWKTKFGSKMTAILAYNDPSAQGALSTVDSSFSPVITGMNGDTVALQQIKAGNMLATNAQPAVQIGAGMAYILYRLLNKKPVPKTVWMNYVLVSKSNVAGWKPFEEILKAPLTVTLAKQGAKTYVVAK